MNKFLAILTFFLAIQINIFAENDPSLWDDEIVDQEAYDDDETYEEEEIYEDTCALYAKLLGVDNTFSEDNPKIDAIAEMIAQAAENDPEIKNPFCELRQQTRVMISISADRRVRVFSWRQANRYTDYGYVVQYKVTPTKSRVIHQQTEIHRVLEDALGDCLIHEINHLQGGIYLLKGRTENSTSMMGIDISTNRLFKSYIFEKEATKTEKSKPFSQKRTFTDQEDLLHEIEYILNGRELSLPLSDEEGKFTQRWETLYFNGVFFESKEKQLKREASIRVGQEIVRLTFRNNLRESLDAILPGECWTLTADLNNDGTEFMSEGRDTITLQDDDSPEFKFMLKKINGSMVVENVNFTRLVETDTLYVNPQQDGLPNVTYICGLEYALTYDWLIYTAAHFDKTIRPDQIDSIRWAVEVDGEIEHLDPSIHFGNQIYLQMEEKWENKAICITAYTETLDQHFYAETYVYKDEKARIEFLKKEWDRMIEFYEDKD